FITADASGPKHLVMKLTRSKFEQLVGDILERSLAPCRQAIKDAGVQVGDIKEVLLVGGSTRIPKVQELVKQFFGKEGNKSVNPDEVVASGASVQGGVLGGESKDILLLDVTPLSLGIETLGGIAHKLIERNTTIPTKKTDIFTTADDNQSSVEIHIVQGEREMARDNRTLGKFHLNEIPPSPRGIPQIEVTFDIDANGILNVSAKDTATGKQQAITITSSSGLSDQDIQKMVKDAEKNRDEDVKKKETIESKNKLDQLCYSMEKLLKENREKIPADLASEVETAVKRAKEAVESGDNTRIQAELESLGKVSSKLSTEMYRAAGAGKQAEGGAQPGPGQEPAGEPANQPQGEGEVIDAEFEDIDKNKK
ncbi:MAG TPA: Hsp70 family protein, partial [Candidatus Aminicenantes bacterium]|nr:Hsp70 family protein [Candidatus Aminicenantes bacterium]